MDSEAELERPNLDFLRGRVPHTYAVVGERVKYKTPKSVYYGGHRQCKGHRVAAHELIQGSVTAVSS